MTYAHSATLCDCGAPNLLWSAFDTHALCTECCCVQVAARGPTGRKIVDVFSVEIFLREFAAENRPVLGGQA